MGGVGKTTLVAKLARDLEDEGVFADGIYWVTLGEEPTDDDLRSWLGGLATYFGDARMPSGSVAERSIRLRQILTEKEALIVLDDAWKREHTVPFLVGGRRCRIIITTRDATIARAAGVESSLHDLDVMTPEEARALITKRLDRPWRDGELTLVDELAEEVGRLPLALSLAVALVAEGDATWEQILGELRQEIARLKTLAIPDIDEYDDMMRRQLSLLANFHVSLRRLNGHYRERFLWLGILREDTSLSPGMAPVVWDVDAAEARETLASLSNKAMLM
jgi:GTPase SAR1 family protein